MTSVFIQKELSTKTISRAKRQCCYQSQTSCCPQMQQPQCNCGVLQMQVIQLSTGHDMACSRTYSHRVRNVQKLRALAEPAGISPSGRCFFTESANNKQRYLLPADLVLAQFCTSSNVLPDFKRFYNSRWLDDFFCKRKVFQKNCITVWMTIIP